MSSTTSDDAVVTAASPVRRRGLKSFFANLGIAAKIMTVVAVLGITSVAAGLISDTNLRGLATDTASLADIQAGLSQSLADVNEQQVMARMLVAQVAAADTDAQ